MPLLHVVGVTPVNKSFSVCFVFMRSETEQDYSWACQQLRNVYTADNFPKVFVTDRELALINAIESGFSLENPTVLLCIWHIEKNLLAKTKKHFDNNQAFQQFLKDWKEVIYSADEACFQQKMNNLEVQYPAAVIHYLHQTWLPYRKMFITVWTKQSLHFGNTVTSRVEGMHSSLKSWIRVSTGDFKSVFSKIKLASDHQHQSILQKIEYDKSNTLLTHQRPFWGYVNREISQFALGIAFKQYEKAQTLPDDDHCSEVLSCTMGIPCSHMIKELIRQNAVLKPEHFHSHWQLNIQVEMSTENSQQTFAQAVSELTATYASLPPHRQRAVQEGVNILASIRRHPNYIQNPEQATRVRGRPQGSLARLESGASTRRAPSGFEIADRRQRVCGICGQAGHNRRTCSAAGTQVLEPNVL